MDLNNIEELSVDDNIVEDGRTLRWRKKTQKDKLLSTDSEGDKNTACCAPKKKNANDEVYGDKLIEVNNEKLFNKIETRARAIGNWKRLKILIVILRMCNGNFTEEIKSVT